MSQESADKVLKIMEQIQTNQQRSLELQRRHLELFEQQQSKLVANLDRAEAINHRAERIQQTALRGLKILAPVVALLVIILFALILRN